MATNAQQSDRRRRNSGRLDLPPRAADRASFPVDFGKRFTVFVETQSVFGKNAKVKAVTDTIRHLPEFQRIAEAHGIIPTYLVNYSVAQSQAAQDILSPIIATGHCVIGALLEPWNTPPHDEERSSYNSYVGNLPQELEAAKLKALTDAIVSAFGVHPQIYRAGRYGIGPNTAHILARAGYRMDVSVRPGFDYRSDGGPDFRRHNARPFWAGADAMLLEMPLGATYTGFLRRFGPYVREHTRNNPKWAGLLARSGALSHVALTPEDMPLEDAKTAVRTMLSDGVQMLNFSLHSPSLTPGLTPYVKTSADLNALYFWWEDMFKFLEQMGVRPIASDAIIAAAWARK